MRRISNVFAHSVALLGIVALSAASAATTFDDPRLAQLAKDVHDKGWIVYSGRTATGDWDVFVMRPDGSSRRNITNTPDSNEMIAGISLDGKRILYRRTSKTAKM